MGRVSRYKKVKKSLESAKSGKAKTGETIWGYSDCGRKPKKRSLTVLRLRAHKKRKTTDNDGFDLEVSGGDEFDLKDLVGSIRKESIPVVVDDAPIVTRTTAVAVPTIAKATNLSKESTETTTETPNNNIAKKKEKQEDHDHVGTASSSSKTTLEAVEEAKLLKSLEKQIEPRSSGTSSDNHGGRKPGESKRAYKKRVKLETRLIIQNTKKSLRNPEKLQRKKEFLKNKKLKKKGKLVSAHDEPEDHAWESDQDVDKYNNDHVAFGEQAERPPIFQVLPRGAVPKTTKKSSSGPTNDEEMELMRRKVQAQYNAIKAQRRQTKANFHL